MKYGILICLSFLLSSFAYAQYEGGAGDGNDRAQAIQIDLNGQPFGTMILYYGGEGDGQDVGGNSMWMNGSTAGSLYTGGSGDGADVYFTSSFMEGVDASNLYSGGNGDGHFTLSYQSFLNNQSAIALYSGGDGDGQDQFSVQVFMSGEFLDMLYGGGIGDGQDMVFVQASISGLDLAALYSGGGGDGQDKADYFGSAIPFPVSLLSFEAFPQNDFVVLQWVTESELNNDFFTIERSQDADLFEALERVAGAGTTNEMQMYESMDLEPLNGNSFYRLKSTDFDGAFTYSQIVEVNVEKSLDWSFIIYPNPNSGEHINVRLTGLERGRTIHALIMDMQGKTVWENNWVNDAPIFERSMDVGRRLPEGTYQVRVRSGTDYLSKLVIVR
ncbi:MAG: T9SS type A sorting domain-containing protein [Bacteroidota bacterium]